MVQVIPFLVGKEPPFLPLLARGLSDLAALRFNAIQISAQVNPDLKINNLLNQTDTPVADFSWQEGEELWFTGELINDGQIRMTLVLFQPSRNQLIYRDNFQVNESQFLQEWEHRFDQIICYLKQDQTFKNERRMFTDSLEAFLAFRKGLETIAVAKRDRDRETGLESILEAITYDPEFTEAADILILFLIQTGFAQNYDQSISILERLRDIANRHPRIPLVLAEVYYQSGNLAKMESILKELVHSFPEFSDGWIRLALLYHSTNRLEEALTALENILAINPKDPTVLDLMGAVYAGLGRKVEAEAMWCRALDQDPERVNIINNLGLLAEENEKFAAAEEYYQQAITINENWWGSFFHYGSFCRRVGRLEEAVIWLERAAELNPNGFQVLQNLGLTQIQLGKYSEGQETLLKLLQLAPDNESRRPILQQLNQLDDQEIKTAIKIRRQEQNWDNGKRRIAVRGLLRLCIKAYRQWYYWYLWGRFCHEWRLVNIGLICWRIGLFFEPGYLLLKKIGLAWYMKQKYCRALPVLRKAFQLHQNDQEVANSYLHTLIFLEESEELQANINKFARFTNFHDSLNDLMVKRIL